MGGIVFNPQQQEQQLTRVFINTIITLNTVVELYYYY